MYRILLIFLLFFSTKTTAQTVDGNYNFQYKHWGKNFQFYDTCDSDIVIDGDFTYVNNKKIKHITKPTWTNLRNTPGLLCVTYKGEGEKTIVLYYNSRRLIFIELRTNGVEDVIYTVEPYIWEKY